MPGFESRGARRAAAVNGSRMGGRSESPHRLGQEDGDDVLETLIHELYKRRFDSKARGALGRKGRYAAAVSLQRLRRGSAGHGSRYRELLGRVRLGGGERNSRVRRRAVLVRAGLFQAPRNCDAAALAASARLGRARGFDGRSERVSALTDARIPKVADSTDRGSL